MIVDDFDIECMTGLKPKADTPLIIDTDAEAAVAVASQSLKPIVRWYPQIIKPGCTMIDPAYSRICVTMLAPR